MTNQGIAEGVVLPPPSRLALASAVCFASCNLVLSIAFGDLYPFTITPMFCDSPRLYSVYQVLDPQGVQLPLRDFQLQRNYDGNPIGLGAGVRPAPSFDKFGTAPEEADLRAHVARVIAEHFPGLPYVNVVQTVIGPVDEKRVGVIRETRMRVNAGGN